MRTRASECVFIISRLWRDERGEFTFGLLNSCEGIRVYRKGELDPRLTGPGGTHQPYPAKDMDDAIEYMSGPNDEHLGEFRQVQLSVTEGYRWFKRESFAPLPKKGAVVFASLSRQSRGA